MGMSPFGARSSPAHHQDHLARIIIAAKPKSLINRIQLKCFRRKITEITGACSSPMHFLFCCNPLSVGRFNGGPIDGVARQRSDTQQSQDKDFSLKLPSRLEAVAQHADEKQGDCNDSAS